ncbi:MAG: DNA-processing protein DprA [Clostridia bacterium]|nr:DNA-processing protein DprA [Clostridia bacterium]
MERRVQWILLATKNKTCKKMREAAKNFESKRKSVDMTSPEALSLMDNLERALLKGYSFITYLDEVYPEELRNIAYPPPYLFVRGNLNLLAHPLKAAIVGSREATPYGLNTAADFAHTLAASNVCIVTGGARGIDAAAIRGALRHKGNIIVVAGTGIDVDYPPENAELFYTMCEKGGLIVSEFPMGMGPLGRNFPVRNRIMTAISESVTIVEAAEKSGALISASYGAEQGKSVFAVPGNIDSPNSVGTNALLRDGALMATSGRDILYEMMERVPEKFRAAQGFEPEGVRHTPVFNQRAAAPKENESCLSPYENMVVNALKTGKSTYEEIMDFTNLEAKKLTSLLTIMEIKGIIKLAFNNRYKLN